MAACTGGQAGDYGWLTCSTSGTVHTLCACACTCNCCTPAAGLFTGSPGQWAAVTDCSVANCYRVAPSACGGSTCCQGPEPMNSPGCNQMVFNPAHSNYAIQCCCFGFHTNNWVYSADCTTEWVTNNLFNPTRQMPFQQVQGTSAAGVTCNCCLCFNFYVRGGCGWSNPAELTFAYTTIGCWYNVPMNTFCGFGMGRGGSAYAGGAGQLCDCAGYACMQFGGVNGNAPGGGGSSASGTGVSGGCCLGSCGGLAMILISWS